MAAFQGYNPYGGYGMPMQMNQSAYQQMYMPTQQTQMQQAAVNQGQQIPVAVRFVTKFNEADAAQIAFDNTINLFINLASGEIYLKRFDPNSGLAPLVTYRQEMPKASQEAEQHQEQYATVEMVKSIEMRLNELSEAVATKRTSRGAKADE